VRLEHLLSGAIPQQGCVSSNTITYYFLFINLFLNLERETQDKSWVKELGQQGGRIKNSPVAQLVRALH
jgi:hypothetical protein